MHEIARRPRWIFAAASDFLVVVYASVAARHKHLRPVESFLSRRCHVQTEHEDVTDPRMYMQRAERTIYALLPDCPGTTVPHRCAQTA